MLIYDWNPKELIVCGAENIPNYIVIVYEFTVDFVP
jgi:hypothetical protein